MTEKNGWQNSKEIGLNHWTRLTGYGTALSTWFPRMKLHISTIAGTMPWPVRYKPRLILVASTLGCASPQRHRVSCIGQRRLYPLANSALSGSPMYLYDAER